MVNIRPKELKRRIIRTNTQTATEVHSRDTDDAAYTFEVRTEHGAGEGLSPSRLPVTSEDQARPEA